MNPRHIAGTVSGPGTQTVDIEGYRSDVSPVYFMEVSGITGTGTLTIAARFDGDADFSSIVDGTVDLGSPAILEVKAPISELQVTPSSGSDEWTLTVYQA